MGLFDFIGKKKTQEVEVSAPDRDSWSTYKEKLFEKMPFLSETLRDGVSPERITEVEKEIGTQFTEELRKLYLTNDGDTNEAMCGMMLGFHFLSFDELIREVRSMKSIPEYSDKKWIPFSSDGSGNFIAVDPETDTDGRTGRVINFGRDEKEVTVLADSLGALFERFTRIVCSEDFYIGDYDGEDVILLGTDDVDEGSYLTDYLKSENSVK